MALTGEAIIRLMKHGIDGADPSPELNALELANQAGEWFYDCYGWRWKLRPPAILASVASQEWLALPTDFGEMVGVPRGTTTAPVLLRMVTMEQVSRYRAVNRTPAAPPWYGALIYTAVDQDEQTISRPRIEIWPPALETSANIGELIYSAAWVPLTSDDSIATFPNYCNALYIQIARAFLSGLEDEEQGSIDDRLARIMDGALYKAAVLRDSGEQNDYGQMPVGPAGMDAGGFGEPSPYSTFEPYTP